MLEQNPIWVTKRLLGQARTLYKNWNLKVEEERAKRLQRIKDLEAHLEYLEAAELDEMSL